MLESADGLSASAFQCLGTTSGTCEIPVSSAKAKNKFPFGSQHTLFKDLVKKYKSDSVSFLEINHTDVWKHSFGGLPEWLKFEIGPYCPKCKEEMSFFAQLSFPANYGFDIDRHLYIFICTSCQLTTSLIK